MTEREKMLAGEFYDSRDPELLALARSARALLARFNAGLTGPAGTAGHADTAGPLDPSARADLLERLLGGAGEGVWIESPFFCDYGVHTFIGRQTFVNVNCVFLDAAEIRVGARCLLGPGVQLVTTSHPPRAADRIVADAGPGSGRAPYRTRAEPIVIGDEAWIGAGVQVMPGVTIGRGAVIGAGSVVTRDVPADVVAFGQPCRVQRELG